MPMMEGKTSILAAVCLAALLLPLNFSGGAVATPAIGRELGGNAAALTWITNAFMLSFGSLLMAAGALADQFGRKRVFAVGVMLLVVTSLALSFSSSASTMDLLRAAQGIAAAGALAGGTAALAQEFEGHQRAQAFSLLGTTFGFGLAFGPLLAGLLTESFGWRSIFLVNAAVGMLVLGFGLPQMRETRDPNATGVDWAGTFLFTGALSLFTFAVIQGPVSGWSSPIVGSGFIGAAVLLIVFIAVELRLERPMLDLSLFRIPRFIGVQALPVATCYCYVVLLVLLPLRLIGIDGRSEIQAGLILVALSAPMLIVPFLAATLVRSISPGVISGVGLLIAAAGLIELNRSMDGSGGTVGVWPLLLIGVGAGLPWGLMDGLSVSVVPKERAGMATGIFSTTRVAGEGIALAVVIAILNTETQWRLRAALPQDRSLVLPVSEAAQHLTTGALDQAAALLPNVKRAILVEAYTGAFRTLLYILTCITILSAVVVLSLLRRTAQRSKEESVAPTATIDAPAPD